MKAVSLQQAIQNLPDLCAAAAIGEEVIILNGSGPALKLVPYPNPPKKRQFGSARGLLRMTDDFDAPLEDLADYQ